MAPTGPKIPNFTSPCPAYKGILPLRLLQLAPSLASLTDGLMDHSEDKDMEGAGEAEVVLRLNSTTRLIFFIKVVRLLKEEWGCDNTEEEIIRADGILDVNSVEHRMEGHPAGRALLPITSLCSHSCIRCLSLHLILEQSQSLGGQQHVQGPADGGSGGDPS